MAIDITKIKMGLDTFLDEKISPLKNQHRLIIFIATILALIAVFFFLYYSPKSKEIQGLKSRQTYLHGEIKKVEATVAKLDHHKEEKKEVEKKFEEASKLLPEQKEIPSLLDNISSLGTNSGLNVISFKPKKESPQQFYADIPVELLVDGPYHNVGVFLDKISKLPRIVTVSDITMGSPNKQDDIMILKTKINLLTYRFIETQVLSEKNAKRKRKK